MDEIIYDNDEKGTEEKSKTNLKNTEQYLEKYKGLINYSYSIAYEFYKEYKSFFVSEMLEIEDIKSELLISLLKAFKEYEEKYLKEDKVYLEKHIKNVTIWQLKNLIRASLGLEEFSEDTLESMNEVEKQVLEKYKKKGKVVNKKSTEPLDEHTVSTVSYSPFEEITNEEIESILKIFTETDDEFKVMKLKIIEGLTLEEIVKETEEKYTRQGVQWIYNKISKDMKKNQNMILRMIGKE
jgi:hypothetical protein